MLAKRTLIGVIVGSIIIALGGYSLIIHIGPTVDMDEYFLIVVGDSIPLTIPAPADAPQLLIITGNAFDLKLQSPGDGLKIPNTSYKNELKLEWAHVESGTTKILIQNTGDSDLEITAVTKQTPNPFGFTFDVMVLITGIIIIGMSMGFTMRKPKGF
ncbi:MAG: hypothetical protein COA77_07920 [Thaumarchaeota archaeon]|nr:MAG: hypothetical protein COA77_07920 [Nitrososphaerota archaeon]